MEFPLKSQFTPAATRLAGMAGAVLGWRPHEFWSATPAELACIVEALSQRDPQTTPPSATDIAQLMEMYPDG